MSFIADLLAKIGMGAATTGTQGCYVFIIDEPKMPKCLIEK
ncbi:MAG: cyclic lactone autoinducer peptide [Erysipelotrichaceae bacterium]|nr:cyclic lactone autoinducer peptide [Erysipelotrichaceae bacterium]